MVRVEGRKSAQRQNHPTGVPSLGGVIEQANHASSANGEVTTDGLPVVPGEGWGCLSTDCVLMEQKDVTR